MTVFSKALDTIQAYTSQKPIIDPFCDILDKPQVKFFLHDERISSIVKIFLRHVQDQLPPRLSEIGFFAQNGIQLNFVFIDKLPTNKDYQDFLCAMEAGIKTLGEQMVAPWVRCSEEEESFLRQCQLKRFQTSETVIFSKQGFPRSDVMYRGIDQQGARYYSEKVNIFSREEHKDYIIGELQNVTACIKALQEEMLFKPKTLQEICLQYIKANKLSETWPNEIKQKYASELGLKQHGMKLIQHPEDIAEFSGYLVAVFAKSYYFTNNAFVLPDQPYVYGIISKDMIGPYIVGPYIRGAGYSWNRLIEKGKSPCTDVVFTSTAITGPLYMRIATSEEEKKIGDAVANQLAYFEEKI